MLPRVVCLSLCLASLATGQGDQKSSSSILAIINMASCRSTCMSGSCKQQVGTAFPSMVKCVCNIGWMGENCDVPNALNALKMFRFPSSFLIPGAAITADLALIDKRVRNRDSRCADNFVCHNDGYCTGNASMGYKCKCFAPYTGTFCSELCEKKCYNGGECFREVKFKNGHMSNNQVCKCPRQYQGEYCELKRGL